MSQTDPTMLSNDQIQNRIAMLRANIRQITELAASVSGAADEERNAERIAQQTDELETLVREQERRQKKKKT